jgi:transposase-like protein
MNATMTEVVDDGRKPDRLGRVRTPRSRREELLAEYDRRGLSQAAFARRAGVRYPTFAHWVQERRRGGGLATGEAAPGGTPRFVELRLPGTPPVPPSPIASELSVTMPDGVVLRGAEPSALATLVRALRKG